MREEREAALLKAKKQQSSKNSRKGYLLKHLLKAMNMARSTYYFEINKTDPVAIRNEELLLVIKKTIRRKQRQIWGTQSLIWN